MRARRAALWIAPLLALAILPRLLPGSFALTVLTLICLYSSVALGLQLLMGYAGQISLGQGAFFGIGAYAYGILAVKFHVSPWPALVAAALINGAIAYVIGKPILRLSGHQLALATLAFGIIVATLFNQMAGLTGGALGLGGIPHLSVGSFRFDSDLRNAYLAEGFAAAMLILAHNMMRSRVGRALQALSANEQAAASLGVDVAGHKLHIFALSAVFASLAGTLYASYLSFVSPDAFSIFTSVQVLVMAAVGGIATVWGAPLGAATIFLLREGLAALAKGLPSGSDTVLQMIVFGLILVTIMIFLPQGLTRGLLDVWRARRYAPQQTLTPALSQRERESASPS
ncbi:MAG TPA: branched-chain amino acid ABC transporter permease [Chloroflexota bacterium]|nr:branched-chain amino acid ABC transporter permease [Chloroflexota bacterium]